MGRASGYLWQQGMAGQASGGWRVTINGLHRP